MTKSSFLPQQGGLHRFLWRYLLSIFLVVLASAISIPVHWVIEPVNLVMLYLAVVVIAAIFLGRGPAILASVLSVLMFDFFLVEPRLSLTVADAQYLLTFFGLLAVGLIISTSAAQLRAQLEIARRREAHAAALNSLSQDLTGVISLDEMLQSVTRHISQTFDRQVVVFLPVGRMLKSAAASQDLELDIQERSAADWAYRNQELAGWRTSAYPNVDLYCLPLKTSMGCIGVLAIRPQKEHPFPASEDHRRLLQGFANLTALAIERARLAEQASQAKVVKNTERLQEALLGTISHELRTPLVSITGALSSLAEDDSMGADSEKRAARRELIDTAYEEAQRLNLLVGNLLDMSRLEAGAFRLALEPCDMQDLVGIALLRFSERRPDRSVQTSLDENLPLITLDVTLMVQVLINLLENAAKYSPEDSQIKIDCTLQDEEILLSVSDDGIGIPPEELEKIFEKFYRSSRVQALRGIGLGLSISKSVVEAHNGRVWAQNRPEGGTTISVALPIHQKSSPEEQV